MRLSRDVMPLKKNRMGFIPCEGTSSKGFPFKRGEICYKYVHMKTGIMKCTLLKSFHLKDEWLSHVDCNTRVSIVGCKPYTIQANDGWALRMAWGLEVCFTVFHWAHFGVTQEWLYSVAYIYAVWPVYDVKCLQQP